MTNRTIHVIIKSMFIAYGAFLSLLTFSKKYSFDFWDENLIKLNVYFGNSINLFIIISLLLLTFLKKQKKIILLLTIVCSIWIILQITNELTFYYYSSISSYLLRTFFNGIVLFSLIFNYYSVLQKEK